ncbi:MAG: MFS transporter [Bifidobacteriales bacterium]|nr:MFS transporter [Bifidobacteriales bacterium]
MSGTKELWSSKGYIAWFSADTAMAIGTTLRGFAIPLIAFSVSSSLATAGWVTTLSVALEQICQLFGGTIVDRHPRKPMIIGNAVVQTLLWSLVSALMLMGRLNIVILFAVTSVSACTTGAIGEATDAALRSIIGTRNYAQARSINEGRDATINMAGSPIGGILYGLQPWLPFVCSALVYAVAGCSATRLHLNDSVRISNAVREGNEGNRAGNGGTRQPSFISDFLDGWRWTFHSRRLPTVIAAASLINFGVAGIQYTIQLHLISTGTQPFRIGLMNTGVCAGMLIGSILANRLSDKVYVGTTMCAAFVMTAVFVVPMLFNNNYWVIFICYALMAMPFPMVNSMLFGFVFSKTDEHLQGRVATVISAPAQILSMFCSGIAGSLLPIAGFTATTSVFLAALAASALITLLAPAIKTIPKSIDWESTQL